ncbi:MAG: hypothetical protein PHO26_08335 [Dehalococcoidia bacterium]|nr:hypothetical protein [Dehalococcoidia bacterium]MDD5493246.1 hypothetical protein [Dehalococcoidia bacterium]
MAKSLMLNLLVLTALLLAALGGACATDTSKPAKEPYASDTYANDDFGFYIKYPKTWKSVEPTAPYCIFRAQSPTQLPSISISVFDPDKVQDQAQEIYNYYKLTNIKPLETKLYVLADGKTQSQYSRTKMTHPDTEIVNYAITFEKYGKYINVGISTVPQAEDAALYDAIFQTITFYK